MIPKTICIYHGNCADGFASAWVVRKYFGEKNKEVEFHAGVYQNPPPDVTGKDVIIVDFSYKRNVIEEILVKCNSMIIIDHHKSAIEDLMPLVNELKRIGAEKLVTVFDVEHSGCVLTWNYLFPEILPPVMLRRIEDRDLWKFIYTETRDIQANIFSFPYDFEVWDSFMDLSGNDLDIFAQGGTAIERKHFKDIKELLAVGQERMIILNHTVPCCNLPYTMSSDAGDIMSEGEFFAACYMIQPNGIVFSLRSSGKEGSLDVSKIASAFGGGGHRNAAGFRISYKEFCTDGRIKFLTGEKV